MNLKNLVFQLPKINKKILSSSFYFLNFYFSKKLKYYLFMINTFFLSLFQTI